MVTNKNNRKVNLDIEQLIAWLRRKNIRISMNEITHRLDIMGFENSRYNRINLEDQMHVIIHDELQNKFKCTKSQVQDLLSVISQINRRNPVLELLDSENSWDGKDRIGELFEIMHIDEADDLSRVLIRKWLWQTMSMAHNGYEGKAYGAEGILVLQGPQGTGKTTLCRALGVKEELVKTGLYLDVRNKDTLIRSTTCWIGELGEFESTLRTDIAWLKSFITADTDIYRVPYGRSDITYPRHTSFVATCNSKEFLVDTTGSRRFWVIPVKLKFDLARLERMDAIQLWRQVHTEIALSGMAYSDCFRLNDEELALLQERNCQYNKKLRAQSEIEDILWCASNSPANYEFRWTTATQFKEAHASLQQFDAGTIGRALKAMGIEEMGKRLDGSRIVSKGCRFLPFPKNNK